MLLDTDLGRPMPPSDDPSASEPPLEKIIAAYLQSVAVGQIPDRQALLVRHAEQADELRAFFTSQDKSTAEAGSVLSGRYQLIKALGHGRLGEVWLAEQLQPVRRQVALKLIKAGMYSRGELARFEAERQALALLDHPHVVKVLDGGVTEQGRPFYTMEYVEGPPLARYCDDARLTIEERLRLFVPVYHAVQHALQKGIGHCDLKPASVLVCLYDGKPVPKLVDIGTPRAAPQPQGGRMPSPARGTTPGASFDVEPDQAQRSGPGVEIDAGADMGSMGAVLYELLAGTTPQEKQRVKDATWQEMLRLIKAADLPPSSTPPTESQALPAPILRPSREHGGLRRSMEPDLDWLVMKPPLRNLRLPPRRRRRRRRSRLRRLLDQIPLDLFGEGRRRTLIALTVLLTVGAAIGLRQGVRAMKSANVAFLMKDESDEARHSAATKAMKAVEVRSFATRFSDWGRRANREHPANSSMTPGRSLDPALLLELAGFLKAIPSHVPEWRGHVIMTLLLRAVEVAPPTTLPERPGLDVVAAVLSPDDSLVLTVTNDRTIQIRQFPSLEIRCDLRASPVHSGAFQFLPGNQVLCALDAEREELHRWSAETGEPIGDPLRHMWRQLVFSPDGSMLLTLDGTDRAPSDFPVINLSIADEDGIADRIQIWDARTTRRVADLVDAGDNVTQIAFDRSGEWVVGVCGGSDQNANLIVWSLKDGTIRHRLPLATDKRSVDSMHFSDSGRVLAVLSSDQADTQVIWIDTGRWSISDVSHLGKWLLDRKLRLASGSDEYGVIDNAFEMHGVRQKPSTRLDFAPCAARGNLLLTNQGAVHQHPSGKLVVPRNNRNYAPEATQFALGNRWLVLPAFVQEPEQFIDLAVERPLMFNRSLGLRRMVNRGFGYELAPDDGFHVWLLPTDTDAISPDGLIAWAQLLACGELNEQGQFRRFTEEEWEARREAYATALPADDEYRLPGLDPQDQLYWLRRTADDESQDADERGRLLDRLLAKEPNVRNYLARAKWRQQAEQYTGCLQDQLQAAELNQAAALSQVDNQAAYKVALTTGLPEDEYETLLRWTDRRVSPEFVFEGKPVSNAVLRSLAFYRLSRFTDALEQLQSIEIGPMGENADAILVRAMLQYRLGDVEGAKRELGSLPKGAIRYAPPEIVNEAKLLFESASAPPRDMN